MTTAGLLLAAGASRRFGAANKLLAVFDGRPLVVHAGSALAGAGCDRLIAVTADPAVADLLPGFEIVAPGVLEPGQADSLRAGLKRAQALGAERVLVALGDMPFVTADHLRAVLERAGSGAAASTDGMRRMPPACFPAALFRELVALTGDRGAQVVLAALPAGALVPADADVLRDIDTPADLAAARA